MNRTFFRFVSVAAMLIAVTFVTLPTAEARGLSGSQRGATNTNDLWSTSLAWIANLLPGGHVGQGGSLTHRSSAATTLGTGTGTGTYTAQPNTGSCIDPMGGRCTL